MAGKIDLAKASLQELKRVQPNISLAWLARELPLPDEAERQLFLEAVRRAGLN
jgi:hypothetical protein